VTGINKRQMDGVCEVLAALQTQTSLELLRWLRMLDGCWTDGSRPSKISHNFLRRSQTWWLGYIMGEWCRTAATGAEAPSADLLSRPGHVHILSSAGENTCQSPGCGRWWQMADGW